MMYFRKNGSYKKLKESAQTIEGLKQKYPDAEISDEEGLQNHLSKYLDAYLYLNPYSSEINEMEMICWSKSSEDAEDCYYNSCEEI